jgi:endonuclease/exonuclease/phosphatase family metal-dependent hydrolase
MDDIPPRSYGPLIETTLRIVTWNVWGLYGPWREREAAIVATLRDAHPDIVVLTESWSKAVRELLTRVQQAQDTRAPLVVCGDLNADPDSDEIRMLTGRTTAPVGGLSFYDAWEVAGPPTPGHTWSNNNPWATQLLWPNRRIDYIFSAAPRRGGAGHPRHTALLGAAPVNNTYPSDHYALLSDLRY